MVTDAPLRPIIVVEAQVAEDSMPNGHENTLGAAAPVNIVDTGSAFDSARNPEPGIADFSP